LAQLPLIKGVREFLNWHQDERYVYTDRNDLMGDSLWLRNFAHLATLGFSFDLQIYPHQFDQAARLASQHPDTGIVLNQTGMPIGSDPESFNHWVSGMRSLAPQPNVTAKISGLGMIYHDWTTETVRPYVTETPHAFGTKRTMFASNLPVDGLYTSLPQLYAVFDELTGDLPQTDRRAFFGETVRSVYRLEGRQGLRWNRRQ
jgi:predicted TIM-barrel fold metal-dependent hydrolase